MTGILEEFHGLAEDRQRPQTKEVHLEQPELFELRHRELGRDVAFALATRALQRDVVHERIARNDDPGRMRGRVSRDPLHFPRGVDQLANRVFALIDGPQFRHLRQRAVNRDSRPDWDQLGDAVGLGERASHRPPDVAHRRFRGQRPEGHDLGHPVVAIFGHDVVDDFVAPVVREVDVDVRHRNPRRVEKSLEDQVVCERVKGRDPEGVRDDAARRRAAARADQNPLLPRKPNEIPDDQEVVRETHALDDVELVGQSRGDFAR